MEKVSIVIPACDEEENLAVLLDRLLRFEKEHGIRFRKVIVNDGSRDRTGEIADAYASAEEGILALHNPGERKGMGYALKWGTRTADTPVVVWLMGDLSDDLETILAICHEIERGKDVVVASRYMAMGSTGDLSRVKSFLSGTYSFVMTRLFGIPVHDINNAFRGFRREIFDRLHLVSDDFAISPEFIITAHRAGYRIGEVPTTYTNRRRGQNKFRMLHMIFRYSLLLRYLIPINRRGVPPETWTSAAESPKEENPAERVARGKDKREENRIGRVQG